MKHVLSANGVDKSFGGVKAVNNVSLRIREGEISGVIGPNGAGKTTLFNCITGYYRLDKGQVQFKGEDITTMARHDIVRLGMARTFQNGSSFPGLTVEQHLKLGLETVPHKGGSRFNFTIASLLDFFRLTPYRVALARDLPHGVGTRVQIAVALTSRPDLLLLDEPAGGMNTEETAALRELLFQIRALGVTICLIEHDMSLVMSCCDRILVLNLGRRLAEGTPEEIQQNQAVIDAYLGSETIA
ncbi:MAG: ABC transporter ATP-binding protein [Bacillota bacterium]